uniref:HDC03158 n=1 Tax=Drosophila melanogaster TaxID=7227 RepID=Q6IH68_DROME|nr:TPA_inf: HDC03158 [Drosophila melanogaster]
MSVTAAMTPAPDPASAPRPAPPFRSPVFQVLPKPKSCAQTGALLKFELSDMLFIVESVKMCALCCVFSLKVLHVSVHALAAMPPNTYKQTGDDGGIGMAAPGTVSYVIHECATAQRSKDTERRTRLEHHARAAGCGIAMASGQDDGVRSLAACVRSVRSVRSVRGTYFRNSMQMCAARRDVCFDFQAKKDGEEEEPPRRKTSSKSRGRGRRCGWFGLAGCEFLGARRGEARARNWLDSEWDSWQWQRTKEQPSEQAVKKVSTKTATATATGRLWAPKDNSSSCTCWCE